MSSDPNYIQNLQAQGNAQGLAKLRSLILLYQTTLAKFPKAQAEANALLIVQEGVDLESVINFLAPQLSELDTLSTELDLANVDASSSPDFVSTVRKVQSIATLRNAAQCRAEVESAIQRVKASETGRVSEKVAGDDRTKLVEKEQELLEIGRSLQKMVWSLHDGMCRLSDILASMGDQEGVELESRQRFRINELGNRGNKLGYGEDGYPRKALSNFWPIYHYSSEILNEIPDIEKRYVALCSRAPQTSAVRQETSLEGASLVILKATQLSRLCEPHLE